MTKMMLPTVEVARLVWNDAACDCSYKCHDYRVDAADIEPCDQCVINTYLEKLAELGDKFLDSIEEKGILAPILLDENMTRIYNGHHRVIVAFLYDIPEVPVLVGGDMWDEPDCDEPGSYY